METLVANQVSEAPQHPALPGAEKYDVREIRLHWSMREDNAVLELELSTHEDYAILRFVGVEDLHVPCGDLMTAISVRIQDTSQCPSGTHHILPVRVGGTGSEGLSFWAHSVERLTIAREADE